MASNNIVNLSQFDILNNPNAFQQTAVPQAEQGGFWSLPIEEQNAIMGLTQGPKEYQAGMSAMDRPGWNILENARQNAGQIVTGLTNVWTGLTSGQLLPEAWNYLRTHTTPEILTDYANAVMSPYNLKVEDFGNRTVRDMIGGAIQGAYEHPIDAALDAISLGALSPLGDVSGAINRTIGTRLLPSSTTKSVQNALNVGNAEVRREFTAMMDNISDIPKDRLPQLIEAAETGKDIPKEWLGDFKKLKQFSQDYDQLAHRYAPQTAVDPEELSVLQKYARDNNVTYQQARMAMAPYIDNDLSNAERLVIARKGAKNNDDIARQYVNNVEQFRQGRIFPVTHGLAEVSKEAANAVDEYQRIMAGRFTTREYGNAAYEDIAKQLREPDEFLQNLARQYVDRYVAENISNGRLADVNVSPKGARDTVYINREQLLTSDVPSALKNATKEKVLENDIPISKEVANEIRHQLEMDSTPMSGVTDALYRLGRSNMLAQMTYLGANAITGAANTLINSGTYVLDDIIGAIQSKGRLIRELGIERGRIVHRPKYAITAPIENINNLTGGALAREVDRSIQNFIAEIAANAERRRLGLEYNPNGNTFDQLSKMELGRIISDVQSAALISPRSAILPKAVTEVAGAVNPFWRWIDTATQSTSRLLEKSPVLANTVLVDVLANIGFDREMQERLNLNVSLDQPYIAYKFDPKTGKVRQATAEFVPITTTLKFLFPDQASAFEPSIPFFTDIMNALGGRDRYGNLNKRALPKNSQDAITQVVGTKRIQYNPSTNEFKEIGGQGDEVLSAVLRNMFALPNLYNRTLGPLTAGAIGAMTGQDLHFNQPYAQSIFGDFSDSDVDNSFLFGGNLDRQRTGEDVIKQLSGVYEQQYFDQNRPLSQTALQQFWKNYARNYGRRQVQ